MYTQYTTQHQTQFGPLKIERTYKEEPGKDRELDSVLVTVAGRIIELPKHIAKQTSTTVIRKVCAMLKVLGS